MYELLHVDLENHAICAGTTEVEMLRMGPSAFGGWALKDGSITLHSLNACKSLVGSMHVNGCMCR